VIPYGDHILPMSETPLNKALAALSTRLESINAPTRQVWDPWACPAAFLKVLAHAFSVDLWVDDWSDTRKRSIIANAIDMHRQKGTLAGVLSYLEFVDARLVRIVVPPQRIFSGPNLTRAEREAWLSKLPQVRTWRIQEEGRKRFALYSGGYSFKSFFQKGFPVPSTAFERLRRRARWVVEGIETDQRVTEFGSYFRLHVKAQEGLRVFSDRVPFGRFFLPSDAASRIITIEPKARLPWRSPVRPSLEPVSSEPERVTVQGTLRQGVFSGRPLGVGYFRPSTAPLRVYWRFAVHDGRKVNRRPSIQFMGVGRYSFPAHTAHLTISVRGRRPRWRAGEGVNLPKTRFWLPHNGEPIRNVRRAMVAAKRASDVVLIHHADRPQIIAGQPFLAEINSYVVGRPSQG
jgi:phage tail-like protein